jgi:hypothetical protein
MLQRSIHFLLLLLFFAVSPVFAHANSENDRIVNAMIAEAKKQAAASPGKCVDIFPNEVNQQGADYKLIYLPNRKFKSFKSLDACVDHMMALYKSGGSYPRDMIEKADKKKRQSSKPSMQVLAKTQFDPKNAKSFFCPGRKKVFGRTSDASCSDMLASACDDAHPYSSKNPVDHALRMTCMITSALGEFSHDPDLSIFLDSVKQRRAIFIMSAQGAIPLPKAIQLSNRIMEETGKLARARSQSRRNQGLKTAMLGFCMAQGASISSCLGVPSNGRELNIQNHGILKKSVVDGPNRTCLYNNGGSDFAVTIDSTDLCAMSRASSNQESSFVASGGHLINDYIDGVNRICVYDNAGSLFMRTVESTDVCDASL